MKLRAALLFAATSLAGVAPCQEATPFDDEGPLSNDTFQPIHGDAQAELARGDRALVRWRAGGPRAESERTDAFEAWRTALVVSETGALVNAAEDEPRGLWPDPERTAHRRAEGVEYAVLRRLAALRADELEHWRTRFAPLAGTELLNAQYDAVALARIERQNPLTPGAATAALRLADLSFERARAADSLAWLERAERHAAGGTDFSGAVRARRQAVAAYRDTRGIPDAWETASRLVFERAERLVGRAFRTRRPAVGRAVEEGLALLDDGTVVAQAPNFVCRIGDAAGTSARYPVSGLIEGEFVPAYASRSTGGWPLLPATDGRDVVIVAGRSSERSNALACLRFTNGRPEVRWAVTERGVVSPSRPTLAFDTPPGPREFQPGPAISEGRVFSIVRGKESGGGGAGDELHVVSLDLATGLPVWSRFLAKASDLRSSTGGRFGAASRLSTPAQPVLVWNGRVLAGTNAGLAFLLDAVDGRVVWSFRCRRRGAEDEGWAGSRPPVAGEALAAAFWAPFDSDFLYPLRWGPALDGRISAWHPLPIEGAVDVVAGGADEVLLLGRSGARRALVVHERGGGTHSSLYLGREERFAGGARASGARVIFASDENLFLFDRARDLFLIDVQPLEDRGGGVGGSVYARGDRVFVVGNDTLWIYRAE